MIDDLQLASLQRAQQVGDPDQLVRVLDQLGDADLVELIECNYLAVERLPKDYARKQQLVRVCSERAAARAQLAQLEALDVDVAIVTFVAGVDDVEAAIVQLSVDAGLPVETVELDGDDVDEQVLLAHAIIDGHVFVRDVTNEELTAALLQTR